MHWGNAAKNPYYVFNICKGLLLVTVYSISRPPVCFTLISPPLSVSLHVSLSLLSPNLPFPCFVYSEIRSPILRSSRSSESNLLLHAFCIACTYEWQTAPQHHSCTLLVWYNPHNPSKSCFCYIKITCDIQYISNNLVCLCYKMSILITSWNIGFGLVMILLTMSLFLAQH